MTLDLKRFLCVLQILSEKAVTRKKVGWLVERQKYTHMHKLRRLF